MKTWNDLKQLVTQYDNEMWNIMPPNSSRYSPSIEIGGGFDNSGESWGIEFFDEFFPFSENGKTMEEVIQKAYETLDIYYQQIVKKEITAHYVVGNGKEKRVASFSIEDCRSWRRLEIDFEPYPTKEEAMKTIQ